MPVSKRTAVMADGRDIIYYDDPGSTHETVPDARDLPPRPPTAEMRQDPLTGDWIAVAAARQNRAHLPAVDPLAPGADEIPGDYDVVVFENRSPSFGPELGDVDTLGYGLGRTAPATGRCEVICFDPASTGSFAGLSEVRARTVVEAWADRTAELSALPGIQQVFPFENRGQAIGVTLHHPHGQIYAYPYVTPRTQRLLAAMQAQGPDLFQRILDLESAGERVVLQGEHFTAFVPFAARWPLEVHLLPHRHVPDLAALDEAERDELAVVYRRLLRGLDALYDSPTPYIAAWHQAPVSIGRDEVRLALQITSPRRAAEKLKFVAGSESAMGAWIGDIPPEQAAEFIRQGIQRA
ncbi:MAG TPA: galactose-1-phosphate uridylyltransferase [Rhodoglobus sp.]|nr:galactose-1-phosphate uridylyltransferase [Rhodoglobus sp.]